LEERQDRSGSPLPGPCANLCRSGRGGILAQRSLLSSIVCQTTR
jgi:hypothetical protein